VQSRCCRVSRTLRFLGPLSLAILPWEGAVSTGDGFGHNWGRNGKFCLVMCPATRTDSWHTVLSVKGAWCYFGLYPRLIDLAGSKVIRGMSSLATDFTVRNLFFLFPVFNNNKKRQFMGRSNMARVTTRAPYNVRYSYSGNS